MQAVFENSLAISPGGRGRVTGNARLTAGGTSVSGAAAANLALFGGVPFRSELYIGSFAMAAAGC